MTAIFIQRFRTSEIKIKQQLVVILNTPGTTSNLEVGLCSAHSNLSLSQLQCTLVSLLACTTITFKAEFLLQYADLGLRANWLQREKGKQIIFNHRP